MYRGGGAEKFLTDKKVGWAKNFSALLLNTVYKYAL